MTSPTQGEQAQPDHAEAEIVFAAMASGDWKITRNQPSGYMTDEGNARNAWTVERATAPYCADLGPGKGWGNRHWNAPTALEALQAASKEMGITLPAPPVNKLTKTEHVPAVVSTNGAESNMTGAHAAWGAFERMASDQGPGGNKEAEAVVRDYLMQAAGVGPYRASHGQAPAGAAEKCPSCRNGDLYACTCTTRPTAQAAPAAGAVAGWQMVPVKPTHNMLSALSGEWHTSRHQPERYAAMLAAAPTPAAQADSGPAAAVERVVHLRASREKRIYVAGPMTGLPDFNFPAFNAAAATLRAEGWHVENPAEHGHVEGAGWDDYLRYDLSRVATCGAVYLLPGWPKSKGATLEVHVAGVLGLQLILADGAEPVQADSGVQEDAARYRWLREQVEPRKPYEDFVFPWVSGVNFKPGAEPNESFDSVDAAIDAERAALAAKGEKP